MKISETILTSLSVRVVAPQGVIWEMSKFGNCDQKSCRTSNSFAREQLD